jgi:hypothetical protein
MGGGEEKVYPGVEGTIRLYGRVEALYSLRKMEIIGRNSRKLPEIVIYVVLMRKVTTRNKQTWPSMQHDKWHGIRFVG